jgi:hypothetical protein
MVGESGTDLGLRGFVGLKRYRYYYLTTFLVQLTFGVPATQSEQVKYLATYRGRRAWRYDQTR